MTNDPIAKTFDLTPINNSTSEIVEYERKESNEVFYEIDENIKKTADTTEIVIQELGDLAKQSQHPRAYEVLVQALKQQMEANKTRWDMHKDKIEATKEPVQPTVNHNTAIFTGSTKEILEKLTKKENSDEQ